MNINTKEQKNELGVATPVAIIMALVFALIAGTGVYIWSNMQKDANEVRELRKQLAQLSSDKTNDENTTQDKSVNQQMDNVRDLPIRANEPSCTIKRYLPVIVYSPGGLFTEAEKTNIKAKLTDPFFDYNNNSDIEYVTMTIEKYDPIPAHGYKYNVSAINKNGGYQGFLYGQATPLEWWLPECLGGCNLTDEFKAKYPEIADILE